MHITTRGGSKTQKKYVKSMADFCGQKLLGSRLYPKIELRIELVKDLMKKEMKYSSYKLWRARVHGRKTKHLSKRSFVFGRHKSPNKR